MNKSIFQNLAESLENDITFLKREINHKISLLEKAPGPSIGGDKLPATISVGDPLVANQGFIAGLYGNNLGTIVQNPKVIAAVEKTKDGKRPERYVDPKVAPYKPITNNIGMGMGFGHDDWTFDQTKNFVKQNAEIDDIIAQTDDPEQSVYLSWKQVNNAVSNYNGKTLKDILGNWGLASKDQVKGYPNAVGDQYSVYIPDLALRKKVEDLAYNMMGKPNGAQVNLKLAQIYR